MEKVLTNKELKLVDLEWDAIRLNRDFRDEFILLTSNASLLRDGADEFCEKWGISIPINYEVSLENLLHQLKTKPHLDPPVYPTPGLNETGNLDAPVEVRKLVQQIFNFTLEYDDAALVDDGQNANDKYVHVILNLERYGVQILNKKGDKGELKKILDKWLLSRKGRRKHDSKREIVKIGGREKKRLRISIRRDASIAEVARRIQPLLAKCPPSRNAPKLRYRARKSCFKVFEAHDYNGMKFKEIAEKEGLPRGTVDDQYQSAWERIYGEPFGTKRGRKGKHGGKVLPCFHCDLNGDNDKSCLGWKRPPIKTDKKGREMEVQPCRRLEKFLQDLPDTGPTHMGEFSFDTTHGRIRMDRKNQLIKPDETGEMDKYDAAFYEPRIEREVGLRFAEIPEANVHFHLTEGPLETYKLIEKIQFPEEEKTDAPPSWPRCQHGVPTPVKMQGKFRLVRENPFREDTVLEACFPTIRLPEYLWSPDIKIRSKQQEKIACGEWCGQCNGDSITRCSDKDEPAEFAWVDSDIGRRKRCVKHNLTLNRCMICHPSGGTVTNSSIREPEPGKYIFEGEEDIHHAYKALNTLGSFQKDFRYLAFFDPERFKKEELSRRKHTEKLWLRYFQSQFNNPIVLIFEGGGGLTGLKFAIVTDRSSDTPLTDQNYPYSEEEWCERHRTPKHQCMKNHKKNILNCNTADEQTRKAFKKWLNVPDSRLPESPVMLCYEHRVADGLVEHGVTKRLRPDGDFNKLTVGTGTNFGVKGTRPLSADEKYPIELLNKLFSLDCQPRFNRYGVYSTANTSPHCPPLVSDPKSRSAEILIQLPEVYECVDATCICLSLKGRKTWARPISEPTRQT